MNFKELMKKRSTSALKKAIADSEDSGFKDDRLWTYDLDKADRAQATIRFLPTTEADIINDPDADPAAISPWVHLFIHSFKNNGKWLISTCPTTYGEDCPVCIHNTSEIESTGKSFKELADSDPVKINVRERKRKSVYYSNILIVDDKQNPKNNGKVFLFKYGYAIYSHIRSKLFPEFEDDEIIDVTDPIDGCDFNLKIYKKNDQVSYDKCTWSKKKPIAVDENGDPDYEKMELLWKQGLPLYKELETNKPDLKKLNKRFESVFNIKLKESVNKDSSTDSDYDDDNDDGVFDEDPADNEILDDDEKLKRELGI